MNYQEIYNAIVNNHAEHWGGEFADMLKSDEELEIIKTKYPELYAEAQENFNNYLRSL